MRINNAFCSLTCLMFLFYSDLFPQGMGISEVSITPEAKSILELRSTASGFLVPRMTTADRDLISFTPPTPTSLMIFNTTTNAYNFWNGTVWESLLSSSGTIWSRTGGRTYLTSPNDSVGIGTSSIPSGKFHINNDKTGSDSSFVFKRSGQMGLGTDAPGTGIKFEIQSTVGTALFGQGSGSNPENIGLYGYSSGASKINTGVLGGAESVVVNDTAYGVVGSASITAGGVGAGVSGVADLVNASLAIGVSGLVSQKISSTSGSYYGGFFSSDAKGIGATGFGIYGASIGATTNWAGYFDDGNVYIQNYLGIGVSPLVKLHLGGNSELRLGDATSTAAQILRFTTPGAGFQHLIEGGGDNNALIIRSTTKSGGDALLFNTYNTAATAFLNRMTIQGGVDVTNVVFSNSNIGIGTASPPTLLTVLKTGANPSIPNTASTGIFRVAVATNEGIDFGKMAASPYSGWIQAGYIGTADPLVLQPSGGRVGIGTVNPANLFHVAADKNAVLDSLFIVTSGGNVGIGTTPPNSKVDILSSSNNYPYAVQVSNTAASSPTSNIGAYFGAATGSNGVGTSKYGGLFQSGDGAGTNYGVWGESIGGTGTNIGGYFSASGATNNYAIIVPSTGGNVGIGTTAPFNKLEVDGSSVLLNNSSGGAMAVTISGTLLGASSLTVDGAVSIPAAADYSYTAAKTKYLDVGAPEFLSLQPLTYQVSYSSSGSGVTIGNGTPGNAGICVAPVFFPDGATVTNVDARVIDNSAANNCSVSLIRGSSPVGTTGATVTMATTTVSGAASVNIVSLTDVTIASAVIDNSLYFYYLNFNTVQGSGNALSLRNVIITYTITKTD